MFQGFAQPRRLTAVVAAVAACTILTAGGCGTDASIGRPGGRTVIVIHDDANGKTVSVGVGDSLELILSSSYWNVTGSSAPHILRQAGPAVLLPRPSGCPDISGLGCAPLRAVFTALTGGKAVIAASRSVCGEALRCVGRSTRFTLTVIVRNQS